MRIRFSLLLLLSVMFFTQAMAQKPMRPSGTQGKISKKKIQQKYSKTLKQYFDLNGSWETFDGIINQMIDLNKSMFPNVDTGFWDEFSRELQATGKEELFELLLPIYKKHFTLEDLKAFIVFYKSPAGRKLAQHTPTLSQESMLAGQTWGRKISQRIADRIKEKN